MENASKALIMAGGILIGVIIMTIGAVLFASFGNTSEEIQRQIDARAINEFNNHFLKYESMTNCTIHDILSVAGFAKKNNVDFDKDSDYYVTVVLKGYKKNGKEDLSTLTEDDYYQLLEEKSVKGNEIRYFTCIQIEYNGEYNNSRVKKIVFKENS